AIKNEEQRMVFLRTFWRQLDPTPETPTNERLVEHMRRMRYTENNFSGMHGQEGSNTDKGRVYIQYGPPDDIEYNTGGAGEKPYQIWYYEKEGRFEFIFRDRRGIGVYELVHSTQPGEIYNPSWREEQ
ncbi:MAG: GWxTD domain-containing protein, partial [Candidatus Latescibacteria bacterium]|nr:GWxTD domain-containing protein [Candidatus Latescibacterota bacterium]